MVCRRLFLLLFAGLIVAPFSGGARAAAGGDGLSVGPDDWPWWRGADRNGVAASGQSLPSEWGEEKNVLWKVEVPGRGYSSPTVVGDRIYLTTSDEAAEIQSVLSFDRQSGALQWKTDVHQGGFASEGRQGHVRSSKASCTVACDGERVFASFINDNAVHLTALDLNGAQLWQRKVSDYVMHQGYGASPALYGPLVMVSVDHHGGGVISAYDRVSGDLVWSQPRPKNPNYTSPMILNVAGRDQAILVGCDMVASYDPMSGAVNWETPGATTECVTSTVTDGSVVVTSGGYPSKHISVLRGDGSGEQLWRNETMVYVPSMILHDGHLYSVDDNGDARCYRLETGELVWEHRLRAKFGASLVMADGQIYATADDGTTFVFAARPDAFTPVAENRIAADEVQATLAICGNRIYMRVTQGRGEERREMLYCIGE
ncbi:MAG: PQQ-binding-like beta-propeller repeat protein [Candidatus Hydrogenedentes bacterium]|nr:PQQ-binding-like beta-propeller repeat protein [Candidatus Hydrogenedentota bacterium]